MAAGFYALQLTAREAPPSNSIDEQFLFHASLCIAALSVVLRYLTIVFRRSTIEIDVEKELTAPVDDFAQQFAGRHKEGGAS